MKRWIGTIVLFLLTVGVLMLGACGGEKKSEPVSDGAAMEETATSETSKDADPQLVSDIDLPEGFPSDIPMYAGAEFVRAVSHPGGLIMVKLTSSDAVGMIAEFYQDELGKSGWTEQPGMENPAGGKILSFEKNDTALAVQLTEMPDETKISLNLATNR